MGSPWDKTPLILRIRRFLDILHRMSRKRRILRFGGPVAVETVNLHVFDTGCVYRRGSLR